MKLYILGDDSLGKAAKECCRRHFEVRDEIEGDEDIVWVCLDTHIGAGGEPDVEGVIKGIGEVLERAGKGSLILISSQVLVGTCRRLEEMWEGFHFAVSPENIRVAHAVKDFENQARVVVGLRNGRHKALVEELFAPFTKNLLLTDPESAEMAKHVLNCYLGMSIAFINEIARICEEVGADAKFISKALLMERRISAEAPLRPGAPFGLGHLERDIYNLSRIGEERGIEIPIIAHIRESNEVGALKA